MLDAPRTARWTALASAVGLVLACGGSGGGEGVPDIDFAPMPMPSEKPGPAAGTPASGLAVELGLPVGGEMLKKNEDGAVDLLFPSAFDAAEPFAAVRAHLADRGWVSQPADVPPFDVMLTREGKRIQMKAERAGSSVWIRVRTK